MSYIRVLIISLIVGLVGGILGVLLAFSFLPKNSIPASELVSSFKCGDCGAATVPLQVVTAKQTLVSVLQPKSTDTLIAPAEAAAVGIVLTADGFVAAHTLFRSTKGVVFTSAHDRQPFTAEFARTKDNKVFFDNESGLTFFKISPMAGAGEPKLKPITFYPFEKVVIGQRLFSINRAGEVSLHNVLSTDINFSPGQTVSSEDLPALFRVDGALEIGAPVFESGGQLVGIAKSNNQIFPAEFIENIVKQYLGKQEYNKTSLGIQFIDLSRMIPLKNNLPSSGLLLSGRLAVAPNSPAAKAGLKPGDVLVSFDGRRLSVDIPFQILLQRYPSGVEVEAVVLRDNKELKLKIKLQ